jgi:hypothetical protein
LFKAETPLGFCPVASDKIAFATRCNAAFWLKPVALELVKQRQHLGIILKHNY